MGTPITIKGNYSLILKGNQALTPTYSSTDTVYRNIFYDEDGNPTVHLAVRLDGAYAITNLVIVETLPSGIIPTSINNGGVYDPYAHTITWTFASSTVQSILLSYAVSGSRGLYTLSGTSTWRTYDATTDTSTDITVATLGDTDFYIYTLLSGVVYGALTIHRVISDQLVYLHVVPGSTTDSQTIVELVPDYLTPYDISDGGAYDSTTKTLTWGPFADHASRSLSYSVKGNDGIYTYATSGSYATFDSVSYPTAGDDELTIGGVYISDEDDRPVARTVTSSTCTVSLAIVPVNGIGTQKIVESVDTTIEIYDISDGGTWDSDTGQITWSFNDNLSRKVTYRYRRDGDGDEKYNESTDYGVYSVTGTYQFDATYGTIKGDDRLIIGDSATTDGACCSRSVNGVAISIKVAPSDDGLTQKVYEILPKGLTPTDISDDGVWNADTRRIYWGVFSGSTWRTLTYSVIGDANSYTLSGYCLFDGTKFTTIGTKTVTIIDSTTSTTDSSGTTTATTSSTPSPSTNTSSAISPSSTYPTNTSSGTQNNSGNTAPAVSVTNTTNNPTSSASGGGDSAGNSSGATIAGGVISPVWNLSTSFMTKLVPDSHLCGFDESSFTSYTPD